MVPGVSMCHTQHFCGWYIAYKRMGPPGTIHIVGYLQEPRHQRIGIFASNTYGSVETTHKNCCRNTRTTSKYPHRPCVIISGDLDCVPDDRIQAPSWIGSGVLQGSTGLWYNAFTLSICLTQGQIQSIHCPGQRTYRPVPHRASARDNVT